MRIWICRHGETELNSQHRMQGILDEPLCQEGLEQAEAVSKLLDGIHFDAVYSSPLDRARKTACIVGRINEEKLIVDSRITEVNFGKYEGMSYLPAPFEMTLFWLMPWFFPAPDTVEPISSLKYRTSSFLRDLSAQDYKNVLVSCHGGTIRALSGYLEQRPSGLRWYPKPKNCEIRVYEFENGKFHRIRKY